jgi:hypothetical protein
MISWRRGIEVIVGLLAGRELLRLVLEAQPEDEIERVAERARVGLRQRARLAGGA